MTDNKQTVRAAIGRDYLNNMQRQEIEKAHKALDNLIDPDALIEKLRGMKRVELDSIDGGAHQYDFEAIGFNQCADEIIKLAEKMRDE